MKEYQDEIDTIAGETTSQCDFNQQDLLDQEEEIKREPNSYLDRE
jgi:hypothetical protein